MNANIPFISHSKGKNTEPGDIEQVTYDSQFGNTMI